MNAPAPKMSILINGKTPAVWSGKKEKCGRPGRPGCGQEIGWGKTEAGKWMPFDLDENCTSHFATCPVAKNFKKEKNNERPE